MASADTTENQARKEFYAELVAMHRHEDELLNKRFAFYITATAFLLSAYVQIRTSRWAAPFALFGVMLAMVMSRVLTRTAIATSALIGVVIPALFTLLWVLLLVSGVYRWLD